MIVVKLQGGLGNQMFQYAAAKRLAIQHNTDVILDLRWFDEIPETDTKRWYELDCFNITKKEFKPEDYRVISMGLGRKIKLKMSIKALGKKKLLSFEAPDNSFEQKVLSLPNNIYLDGWFSSEKYFADIRDVLLADFSFKSKPSVKSEQIRKQIQGSESVSVHVRRGDYISNKYASKWHGLTGLDYYNSAVKIVNNKIKNPELFVFSDDPDWCKANLKFKFPTTYVSHNTKGSEDLRLMVACKHNIITNSTFSWWGAWLNQNPDKVVVAPKKWLNDPSENTEDVIPESWLKR